MLRNSFKHLNTFKSFSTSLKYSNNDIYKNIKKAPADPTLPSAAEIWSPGQSPQPDSSDSIFSHAIYTPIPTTDTAIGPLIPPLRWPEYDQRISSTQASGLPSPPHWHHVEFDDASVAPIGNYPTITPQWAQLRDPFAYWDQQGRRNYGEILYDHENFTEIWSIGPEMHWWYPLVGTAQAFSLIGFMAFLVYLYDPEKNAWFTPKEYPYDGLRLELGGNPEDEADNWMSANHHKN